VVDTDADNVVHQRWTGVISSPVSQTRGGLPIRNLLMLWMFRRGLPRLELASNARLYVPGGRHRVPDRAWLL